MSMLLSQVFIYVKAHMHINSQLGFSQFQFSNGQNGQAGGTASLCQILSKSLELRPRYGDFSNFKMTAAAILDFQHLKFLTFGTVKRVELRNHAKLCRNRSNRGRDIAIFLNFQDGGRRHVGFLKFQIFNDRKGQVCRSASVCQISSKSL